MDFQILGPLRVVTGNQRELALGGVKPCALLAVLLLHPNELVTSDRLIDDLWEGQPPATAAKTLQVHMSRLRRALADASGDDRAAQIVTTRGGYLLDVEPEQVDAQRFAALVADGQAALAEGLHARASSRLRSALAVWRGDALADFTYATFAQDAIARLDGLRTAASEAAIDADLALGRHSELVPELKSLIKRQPLSERLRAQLMLALYRSGRQAEALGVYRAARRLLVEQLGLEPSAELRELERGILAQDADLAAPVARPLARRRPLDSPQRGALVGYDGELAALEDMLEQAVAGQGRLALVAGEPGVGKTRLVDELGAVAEARGAHVVWGRCSAGTGAPAYWPWIQVLRALVGERDALTLRSELSSSAAELTELVPELRDLLPDIAPATTGDPADVRFRLFDATARFLVRAAAARPIVIVLDDLHAADQSTHALLEFVASGILDARILLVATYRDTEARADQPLAATLTTLTRTTDCLQLVLTGLTSEDTAHLVEVSTQVAPLPALASAIHDVTAGNPLFVSELIRLLATEKRLQELERGEVLALPRGVDQVIARRLEQLSASSRRLLSLAAIIGREFDLALLARVAAVDAHELLGHVEEAIAARIVDPLGSSAHAFRFSHDLIRQSLENGLPASERARLHHAVALALEEMHAARPESVVAALAYHFHEALPLGDPRKAVDYLMGAGEAASRLSAGPEAAGHYTRAAEVAKLTGADPALVCELHVRLAEHLVLIGDLQAARAPIAEAEALATALPDATRDARVALARAHLALLDTSTLDDAEIFRAIELFEEAGDHASAARAWWAIANVNCGRSDRLQGTEVCERMLACARRSGSTALIDEARRHIAALVVLGSLPSSAAEARVRALLDETVSPVIRGRMLVNLSTLAAKQARFDEARARIAEACASTPPRDRASVNSYALAHGARVELLARSFHRAEELARANCAELWSQGLVRFLSSELLSWVDALIGLGRLDEAQAQLDRAVSVTAPDDIDALLRQARSRARLALARGDVDAAERFAHDALGYTEDGYIPDEHVECLLVLAEALRAADRGDEAAEVAAHALRRAQTQEHGVFEQHARELLGAPQPALTG